MSIRFKQCCNRNVILVKPNEKIMKRIVFVPFLILIVSSCELIKNATEIDFKSTFKLGYQVDLEQDDNSIYEEEIVSIADDEEAEKYKDKLEDLEVDSVVISITDYSGPENVTISGTLKYSKENENMGSVFANITELNIAQLFSNGTTYQLNYDESEVTGLSNLLMDDQIVKIYLEGTASEVPVSFYFTVEIYSNITAQALD